MRNNYKLLLSTSCHFQLTTNIVVVTSKRSYYFRTFYKVLWVQFQVKNRKR